MSDDEESLNWFLKQIDHLTHIPSRTISSEHGGVHMFSDVVIE